VVKLVGIHELRSKIDEIDGEIIKLLEKRMEISREIGLIKRDLGIALEDHGRESQIYDKAGVYRDIFREILRLSKDNQSKVLSGEYVRYKGAGVKVGIVGYGKMGSLFARIFGRDNDIGIYDIDKSRLDPDYMAFDTLGGLLREAEYILVATPLGETPKVLSRIRDIVLRESLSDKKVFDISTLKYRVVDELVRFPRWIKVCSIHPLFGGRLESTYGEKIVVVPIPGREDDCEPITDFLRRYGFNLIFTSQEEHDDAISYTIILPYFIGLVFGETILRGDKQILERFGGTSYKIYTSYIENILLRDEPGFIEEILRSPYGVRAVRKFLEASLDWEDNLDRERIAFLLERWREKL
jgi:monofunctional chorismate mutase